MPLLSDPDSVSLVTLGLKVKKREKKALFSTEVCLCFVHRLPSRRKAEVTTPVSESSEARQKFANAKAISSDVFFGRESSAEVGNQFKVV